MNRRLPGLGLSRHACLSLFGRRGDRGQHVQLPAVFQGRSTEGDGEPVVEPLVKQALFSALEVSHSYLEAQESKKGAEPAPSKGSEPLLELGAAPKAKAEGSHPEKRDEKERRRRRRSDAKTSGDRGNGDSKREELPRRKRRRRSRRSPSEESEGRTQSSSTEEKRRERSDSPRRTREAKKDEKRERVPSPKTPPRRPPARPEPVEERRQASGWRGPILSERNRPRSFRDHPDWDPSKPFKNRGRGKRIDQEKRREAKGRGKGSAWKLRRPAHRGGDPIEAFRGGEEVEASEVPLEELKEGLLVEVTKGVYWEEEVRLCGIIKGLMMEGGMTKLRLDVQGSPSESLVRWKGLRPGTLLEGHLCPKDCINLSKDGLVHVKRMRKVEERDREDWMDNLLEVRGREEDELGVLRRRAAEAGVPLEEAPVAPAAAAKKRARSVSSKEDSKDKEKRKKKKKKKKEKTKVIGTKSLEQVFGNTGLDPKDGIRRELKKRARRSTRKKGGRKSSASSTSSTSSELSKEGPEERGHLFGEEARVKKVWKSYPGVLTLGTAEMMREAVVSQSGQPWDLAEDTCHSPTAGVGAFGDRFNEHTFGDYGSVTGGPRRAEGEDGGEFELEQADGMERRNQRERQAEGWQEQRQRKVGLEQGATRGGPQEEGQVKRPKEPGCSEAAIGAREEEEKEGSVNHRTPSLREGFQQRSLDLPESGSTPCFSSAASKGLGFGDVADGLVIDQSIGPLDRQLVQVLRLVCTGLNAYYGVTDTKRSSPSAASVEALRALSGYASDVCGWSEKFEGTEWDDYMAVRTVDYQGEEVKIARSFGWRNIEPSLPSGIGSIPLEEVCELGTREFVVAFEDYLLPEESRVYTKPPRIMVEEGDWLNISRGLLDKGVCSLLPAREVARVEHKKLFNGLFAVSKDEFTDSGDEVMRLIMNLVPTNKLVRSLGGDLCTPPSWAGMSPYLLEDNEVMVMSSEDIRCFFYLFATPRSWWPYMTFGKEVPTCLWPKGATGPFYLCSRVLPMGFAASVAIAQHVHRRIARLALHSTRLNMGPCNEIRKDLPFSVSPLLYRIYLDNFDILQKMDAGLAELVAGTPSREILALRESYSFHGLPRHPKKAVEQSTIAEIQGAIVNGVTGLVKPKPQKVLRYVELALQLLRRGDSTQRQVVCGGFVYCCMFRRALLGSLNSVWQFITSFGNDPPVVRRKLPLAVQAELLRFICLVPLAQMNLRAPLKGAVSASDASEYGGGFCISLTPMGCHAANCNVRGDLPEVEDHVQVLTIGLFDGVGALRVSADCLGLPMGGHVSSEVSKEGSRVIESHFPDTVAVGDVANISEETVIGWSLQFSNVGVVVVGGGPPCQGVSGLNAGRKGSSLRDARSRLFFHVPRVYHLCRRHFKWAQVHHMMESVASMDSEDRVIMSKEIGQARELVITPPATDNWDSYGEVSLTAEVNPSLFLTSGWKMNGDVFPTFTTSRPREHPGDRPAGLWKCTEKEVSKWKGDKHRFPPYVYRFENCLSNDKGEYRLPSITEKEVIMGFPVDFTASCLPKRFQQGENFLDTRLTLIGNSWHVPTISWLLKELFWPLGLTTVSTLDEVVKVCSPGSSSSLSTFLRRPPLKQQRVPVKPGNELALAKRLVNFISVKGEDILLQGGTEHQVKQWGRPENPKELNQIFVETSSGEEGWISLSAVERLQTSKAKDDVR
eukprot:Skav204949  [mRNA]  locus=scaffold3104:7120:25458:+ [translate_table: standard]